MRCGADVVLADSAKPKPMTDVVPIESATIRAPSFRSPSPPIGTPREAAPSRVRRAITAILLGVIVLGERTSKSAEVKGEAKGGATKAATGAKPAKAKAGAAAKNKKKPAARNWEKAAR